MSRPKHSINLYFDAIYVVNLEFDLQRRVRIRNQLAKQNIAFSFFSATYGYEGDVLESFNRYQKRPPGKLNRYRKYNELERERGEGFIESPGAMGYIFTYVRLLKEARKKNFQRILILEDDVILGRDFEHLFNEFVKKVPNDWKLLQLGASQYDLGAVNFETASQAGYYQPRIVETCGSFALALHSSVFDELIVAAESIESPFDLFPLGEIYERHLGKCFVAYPNIVMPDVTESYIRKSRNQVEHSKVMNWRMEDFEFPPAKPVVALLIEDNVKLPNDLLRQQQANAAIFLNVYVNTPGGLRPVHHEDDISRYDVLLPFMESVKLPFADYCLKLTRGQTVSDLDVLAALEPEKRPLTVSELIPWPFEISERVPDRVTVILPTNRTADNERLLNAIDSILEQDGVDLEVLIVADKNQPALISEKVRAHLELMQVFNAAIRTEYIENVNNLNDAAMRNTGIFASTGEYICFLDGNDTYLPDRLSACVKALKTDQRGFGGVYCGYLEWEFPENNMSRYPEDELVRHLLTLDHSKHYVHMDTMTYRFAELIKTNGFDESYSSHQDLEFNLRFLGVSSLGTVKTPLVRLEPKPSKQDKYQPGLDLFEAKTKLLSDFRSLISNHDEPISELVFSVHLSELLQYFSGQDVFSNSWNDSARTNSRSQTRWLGGHQAQRGTEVADNEVSRAMADLQLALETSQQQLKDQKQHVEAIENSLTWRVSKIWRHLKR